MKCIYIYSKTTDKVDGLGEYEKVKMQVSALNESGIITEILFHNNLRKVDKLLRRIPFFPIYRKEFVDNLVNKDLLQYDVLYIRKYIFDYSFVRLLKKIKSINSELKILVELPTYPYDMELKTFKSWPLLIKDRKARLHLEKVDRIVTLTNDIELFNIKTLHINNGIQVDKFKSKLHKVDKNKKEINLIAVAVVQKWHGYDRLINGIKEYYEKNEEFCIKFHIVGEGNELDRLRNIVKEKKLESKIIFHGRQSGNELDKIFDICDIAIGSLGMHRIGLMEGCTLKLREYCVRGIPFIKGYNDSLFDQNSFKYMLSIPNDETAVNVEDIINMYNKIQNEDKNKMASYMHEFSVNNLTWNKQIAPVVKFMKESKNRVNKK